MQIIDWEALGEASEKIFRHEQYHVDLTAKQKAAMVADLESLMSITNGIYTAITGEIAETMINDAGRDCTVCGDSLQCAFCGGTQ
jgi:hypothetical protein